jgi:SSS family solute:Na+ symporter
MIAGAVWVAIALATGVPGGIGGIFHQAAVSGHLTIFKWPLSLFQMSALVVAVSFFFQLLYDYGTDQVTVQRLLSIRSNKGTTRAIVFNACTDFFCIGLLLFVGLGLFAFYASNPGSIPQGLSPDRVLPHFIIHELPNGVSGLLIAAILAAAMSSMDSGINSIATVIMIDFLKPLNSYPATEKSGVMLARVLTLVLGAVSTLVAFYVSTIGRIIEAFYTFMGLFSGPVLALFILGIFTKRGSFPGWICGAVMSLGASWWFQNVLKAHWSYFFPVSFLVALTIGYIASVLMPRKGLDESLTVWEKKR